MTSELLIPLTVLVLNGTDERHRTVRAALPTGEAEVVYLEDLSSAAEPTREFIDLCIVDAGTDDDATVTLVQRVRRRWPLVGICCLGCSNVVAVLEAGADDAVPADAGPEVEAAQLAAAFRRARIATTELRVAFGDLVYDREARRVWCAGKEVMLTPRELRLFDILFVRAGAPVSVSTLQDYVWKDDFPRESNALAVYVSYLRRKLSASQLATLESVRGVGYRLARRG
jgi:Response regulators consisting of a CheY-like receiver domain and a winged-helix DNA-binding domain